MENMCSLLVSKKFELNNLFVKDSRGSKPLSVYWFAIVFIVAGAVAYMVYQFYSSPYDVREAEANLLMMKTIDCVIKNNYFDYSVFSSYQTQEEFLNSCKITLKTEDAFDWKSIPQYFIEVTPFDFETNQELKKTPLIGNPNLKDFCNLGEKSSFCLKSSIYVLDNLGKKYKLNFIVSVDKDGKNI